MTQEKNVAQVVKYASNQFSLRFRTSEDYDHAVHINNENYHLPVATENVSPLEIVFDTSVDLETLVRHFELSFKLEI
ncbi:hypothetical protein [Stenotrophomonas sp. 364]|uniref:hypothetical protein n=1 Tax=Stenotrophomonas sp. 364 TaxID=2691571 RepID=UPI001318A439|nr:hypothetical protein [Stenotrophomonas sp. 364]QHB72035.1 hypothetical protein GQ674_12350 [Stenotrophomonas sp. 364]